MPNPPTPAKPSPTVTPAKPNPTTLTPAQRVDPVQTRAHKRVPPPDPNRPTFAEQEEDSRGTRISTVTRPTPYLAGAEQATSSNIPPPAIGGPVAKDGTVTDAKLDTNAPLYARGEGSRLGDNRAPRPGQIGHAPTPAKPNTVPATKA